MPTERKKNDRPPGDRGDMYLPDDFVRGTDAVEKDTDSAWQLWYEAKARLDAGAGPKDRRYAPTTPGGFATAPMGISPAAPSPQPTGPRAVTVEEVMIEARRNNRVCPRPPQWQQLFEMLPRRERNRPTPPLSGASWFGTPSLSKRMCLREHLDWAASHGALEEVHSFLSALPETDWLHMDDDE